MTKDPICGMSVDETTGLHANAMERILFLQRELSENVLVEPRPASPSKSSCCGDKPGAPAHRDNSGDVHKLEAVTPSVTFKCFLHDVSGVESDKPGDCSECGMAVEALGWITPSLRSTNCAHPRLESKWRGRRDDRRLRQRRGGNQRC